jgi:hypothetical protein
VLQVVQFIQGYIRIFALAAGRIVGAKGEQ